MFADAALGLDLREERGRIVVKGAKPGSPGFLAGVPPGYLCLTSVNGAPTAALPLNEVGRMVQGAARPVTLGFDGAASAGAASEESQRERIAVYRARSIRQAKRVPWVADSMDIYDRYNGELSTLVVF
eukprot:4152712-Prymnesium_polylepis.1